MKLFLTSMLMFCALQAKANIIDDLRRAAEALAGQQSNQTQYNPGNPYEPTRPNWPGRPGRPGRPGYPGQPGYGNGGRVVCQAVDEGYEEHSGGHYSCEECLQYHGGCNETCSEQMAECQAQGVDRYGRGINFYGRGDDQWRAQDDAMYQCQYYAGNCRIVSCQQRNNVVSRRNCHR